MAFKKSVKIIAFDCLILNITFFEATPVKKIAHHIFFCYEEGQGMQ